MSDTIRSSPPPDVRLSFRVQPELADRIDTLAAHCGQGRSAFIRASVALADATMSLAALGGDGLLPPDEAEVRRLAGRVAEVEKQLSPTRIM
ncbi:MAG: ribbon-helix-helix domain-containing protein [Solirubrobacteraceae bacterium]